MESACTVWSTVFMLARLAEGEDLLVHGGTSGIGTMAIALGAAGHASVIVTSGTPEKRQHALDAGATAAIDYHEEDWPTQVRAATGGKGADVILDTVGGSYLDQNLDALAVEGRLIVIGMGGGTAGELDLGTLMRKRAAVLATGLRSRPPAQKSRIVAQVGERVLPLLADGRGRAGWSTASSPCPTRSTPTGRSRPARSWARSSSSRCDPPRRCDSPPGRDPPRRCDPPAGRDRSPPTRRQFPS